MVDINQEEAIEREREAAEMRRLELRKELYETMNGIKTAVNKAWAIVELLETEGGA